MGPRILFKGDNNQLGTILSNSGDLDTNIPETEILLENGQTLKVRTRQLSRNGDGSYSLREELTIPVIEEQLDVGTRVVTTGTVRILKTIHEREEIVDEPLRSEKFEVRRVAVNRPVDGLVAVRQEGETTVYPVLEEILIVKRQLILKEEVHVTRCVAEVHQPQRVVLRSEEVTVERASSQLPPSSSKESD